MDEVVLESAIRHVALYRSGAIVTREAWLDGPAWPRRVLLEPLPLSLVDESVRARVEPADGGAADLAPPIDVQVELCLPPPGESLEPPTDAALRRAEERVKELEFLISRLEEANENVDRLTFELPPLEHGTSAPPVSPAVWLAAAAWVEAAKVRRAERKVGLRRELREALDELRRLELRSVEARARRGLDAARVFKRAVVTLRAPRAAAPQGRARLELEYQVPGATWRPTYALRVARDGGRATLSARALVAQRTGEPWDRVRIAVSTAALRREVALPELSSLRIGRRAPEVGARLAWRPPPEGAEALFADLDQAVASQPPPRGGEPGLQKFAAGASLAEDWGETDEDSTAVGIPGQAAARRPSPRPPFQGGPEQERQAQPPQPHAPPAEVEAVDGSALLAGAAPAAPPPPTAFVMYEEAAAASPQEKRALLPWAPRGRREAQPERPRAAADDVGAAAPIAPRSDMLDYASLRLGAWDAGPGERGELRRVPVSIADGPTARGVQPERLREALLSAQRNAVDLSAFPASTRDVAEACGAFDARIEAEGLVDVPADGRPRSVPLLAREGPVTQALVVVPSESDQAVRSATLRNPLGVPLLAGPADVYLGDEFLVTTPLETVPAGGDLVVGLGVEEALKVARNTHFAESTQGLLGGSLTLEHVVEIEVASRLPAPADVEVRERVPVIRDDEKDIELEVGEASPPWEAYAQTHDHPLRGGRRWRFPIGPGESRRMSYSYTIRIDSKHELAGGNRRERE